MSARPPPRPALALAIAGTMAVLTAACARTRREAPWVDTTPNGFVAAPVDPPADAAALDAASRDSSTPTPPR